MATIANIKQSPNIILSATAYGGGYGNEGSPVEISFDQSGMIVKSANVSEIKILFNQLSISAGGFNNSLAMFSWVDYGQQFSVTAEAVSVRRVLNDLGNESVNLQIKGLEKGIRDSHRYRRFYVGLAVVVPVLLVAVIGLFVTKSDRVVQWVVDQVSVESEQKMGDLLFEQTQSQLKLLNDGPLVEMVDEIGGRLTRNSPYQFTWHVASSPTVNAFAMPGGHVVVFTGLISAADSAEEVAGVLAHEVQHVLLRHSLKAMVKNLGWRAMLSVSLGDISGTMIGDMAAQLGELKFSRDAESEADMAGLKILRDSAIDPSGMASFFEKLAKQDGATISILSTHPSSEERMKKLRDAIDRQPAELIQPLYYDWKSIRAVASRS